MNAAEIKAAVDAGKTVHWGNGYYTVIKSKTGDYLIKGLNGHCIGLTWQDGTTLNGKEQDFFIQDPQEEQAANYVANREQSQMDQFKS